MSTIDKIYRLAVTLCLFYFVLKFISLTIEKNDSYKLNKKYIQLFQRQRQKLISDSQKRIHWLEYQNEQNSMKVLEQYKTIDSLEKVKQRINYVYLDKSKKINDFNSKQLENYFRNEFK